MLIEKNGINTYPQENNFITIRKIGKEKEHHKSNPEIRSSIMSANKAIDTIKPTSKDGDYNNCSNFAKQAEAFVSRIRKQATEADLTIDIPVPISKRKRSQKKGSPKKSVREKQDLEVKQNGKSSNDKKDTGTSAPEAKSPEKTAETDHRAVLIIGDSIVREQDKYFVDIEPRHRKRICMPGATLATIHNKCIEEIEETGNDTVHIINGGSNDMKQIKPTIMIEKMKEIIDLYKEKERTLCVTEILPRDSDSEKWQDETYIMNQKLKQLCLDNKVMFIETYFNFYGNSNYYKRDGIHLNHQGSKELGSILNQAVKTMGN